MAAKPPRIFPDQRRKLRFLIDVRGDQRERSRNNPMLARDAADGGHPRDHRSPIVVNQAGLAGFLQVGPPEVSRWCQDRARFPDRLLPELSRLYAIEESEFRKASHASFVAAYGDPVTVERSGAPTQSMLWRTLLNAASGHAEILSTPPADGPLDAAQLGRLRYATAQRRKATEPLPEIAQDAPFWIRLVSPQRPDAGLTWAGWHLVLLNHDLGRDGFRAILPRESNDPADWTTRMPARGWVTLPQAAILRHEAPDLGAFGVVAVLTQEALPLAILNALGGEPAHGPSLEPVLDALTAHLALAMQAGAAGLAVARYRVVLRPAGATNA